MTNYEYYKDKIVEIAESSIAIYNGEPVECSRASCEECACNGDKSCLIYFLDWCMQEYKEKLKLTEREKAFCIAANSGYIARNKNGYLYYFKEKPGKRTETWFASGYNIRINGLGLNFSFIGWKDEEPWSVESLLKLEEV